MQLAGAILGPPQWLGDWLRGSEAVPTVPPRYVIVLGGSGIPSESSLIRAYRAAEFGLGLTGATFIVSLPAEQAPDTSSVGRLRDELVLRGISREAIRMEYAALTTHEQAVNIRCMLGTGALPEPIVVVTSGYHMRRAMLCFRQEGFTHVRSVLASSVGAEAAPGRLAWVRYGIWDNAQRETEMARELTALLYYKLRGWI